ncbi:MAG TPA: prepilin-type N-terminal cleavage/methylation domain-containing protein [Candidatus Paceibacterota bacterium]|jgi:prepilin-type N-terminal cleavage/methylation domain-containing protein|nr:prepilin-type N-terminal cleavage/methylation domain-containing protein [Candidatus Paceibacterota bacterium]
MDVIKQKAKERGFTLIEMLIVVAIFAVVATVLLFHYSDFNTAIAVRDLAQEMGLSVRKAQTYATSVRSIDGGGGILSDTFPAYGVSFSTNTTAATLYDPTNASFTLFVDASASSNTTTNNEFDNNGTCGSPAINQECIESFGITASDKIKSLVVLKNGVQTNAQTVDVVFHRPNPDAIICVPNGNPQCPVYDGLIITVVSPKFVTRTITVWNTGQINVN